MGHGELPDRLEALARAIEASPHNLMSRRGLQELRDRHIPECLAFARLLPAGPARLADIGSGGGLPGLVIAVARPDLEVTLIESTRKKADFLRATAAELDERVSVIAERAEDLGAPYLGAFDMVTARAVAPLERLVPWAVPLLRPGGRLYAIKGERWEDELDDAVNTLARVGATVEGSPDQMDGNAPEAPRVVIIAATGAGSGGEGV